jgi:hypothetical protein
MGESQKVPTLIRELLTREYDVCLTEKSDEL